MTTDATKPFLFVPDWDEMQHYKNRTPPWIKLQNDLLENYDFECLPDASKAHLLCIWLLASRTNNKINPDPKWIQRKICANTKVDIAGLVASGFLQLNQPLPSAGQDASKVQAECLPRGRERVEGEQRESRAEGEENPGDESPSVINRFDDFWKIYPRKTDKKKAKTAWDKISPNDDLAIKIITNVSNRLASGEWVKGSQYIPHPTTYLNGARWDDEPQVDSEAERKSERAQDADDWANGISHDRSIIDIKPELLQ